jgi:Putative transposase/Transposase zinc-binding domain
MPTIRLADIVRHHGKAYREQHALPIHQHRLLRAIENCRTAALGGHACRCSQCGETRVWYNSCRNRHCPQCQSMARAQWLARRKLELLPVNYFHVVFTVPEQIAAIALQNKKTVYDILFRATSETLLTTASDPRYLGANIGYFAILHTWGQNLLHHPHLHCVIPGGGISRGEVPCWVNTKGPNWILPVKVLSAAFRKVLLGMLRKAFKRGELEFFASLEYLRQPNAFYRYLEPLEKIEWVVYAKKPFGGPENVLEYLGRYTHRVAISNQRLLSDKDGKVSFLWKDYREKTHKRKKKVLTIAADEFLRRFLLHALPRGFQRIRHYGLFANPVRKQSLAQCRQLLAVPVPVEPIPVPVSLEQRYELLTGHSLLQCPVCKTPTMVVVELFPPRYPPPFEDST